MQVCKLISTASKDDSYYAEYSIQKGSDEQKHLFSRVALGTNGRFRRFFTVTASCPESQLADVGALLESAVASMQFRLT